MEPADQQRALVSQSPQTLGVCRTAGRSHGPRAAREARRPGLRDRIGTGHGRAAARDRPLAQRDRGRAQEALQARRSEEHTKTELINARAKFAMDVAEIREGAARELDDRCERRAADARKRAAAADAAAASRCALEAHRAQARRDVDAARQEAARADRASNRLLLMLVLAAAGVAALTHRAVVTLPRKPDRRTSRAVRLRAALSEAVASNERAANACVQKIADAHRDGARTKRTTASRPATPRPRRRPGRSPTSPRATTSARRSRPSRASSTSRRAPGPRVPPRRLTDAEPAPAKIRPA